MHIDDFNLFADLLKQRSGLLLTPDKSYLLESRLTPVARKWNLKGLEDLALRVRNNDIGVINDIVEGMTTNESTFFRDTKPFDQFKSVLLPQFMKARSAQKKIRIWCAACSSGQEPYSLAMILDEMKSTLAGWKIEIYATDLSKEMIDKAKEGIYTQFEVQRGLPITLLVKYFDQKGDRWQLKPELRQMVQYSTFNLLSDYGSLGNFDIIFCRNVLIYFEAALKKTILGKLCKVMPPDGTLYLGGAETVIGVTTEFKPVEGHRGMYVKSESVVSFQKSA